MRGAIGVFDSGYGGLTVLKSISEEMPDYDYIYLGDNARTPYGTRSFDVVYSYTLQAVKKLFEMGCQLVILACNTASAKALRSIQQNDLPMIDSTKRVLGVIRPSVEELGLLTQTGHVGILGTKGTVLSDSYPLEIAKIHSNKGYYVCQQACPMWVPIVESDEISTDGADFFVHRDVNLLLDKDEDIDTILLACTHYPLLFDTIRKFVPQHIKIVEQGDIVAKSLRNYLDRHVTMDNRCKKSGRIEYYTTETVDSFTSKASLFMGKEIKASHINL